MLYDLSVLLPAIRTPRWPKFYESLTKACKRYSFEVVFATPFDLPEELEQYDNIKVVKTYGSHCKATQLGFLACTGHLIYLTIDDAILFEDSLDTCIDFWQLQCAPKDCISTLYYEDKDPRRLGAEKAGYWHDLRLPGIDPNWSISVNPIFNKENILDLGGWDTVFQYQDKANHDLLFRLQKNGGQVYLSPCYVADVTWYGPNNPGDHKPLEIANLNNDVPIFNKMYGQPNNRLKIDPNNHLLQPDIWETRFKKPYKTYKELCDGEGYVVPDFA
jgi:hypothetical protein